MENIIRGTTPSLIIDFEGTEVSTSDIVSAVLSIKTRTGPDLYIHVRG